MVCQKMLFFLTPTHGSEHLMRNNVESAGDVAYCGNGRTILETELFNYWTITITRALQQMDGIKALSIWWAFQPQHIRKFYDSLLKIFNWCGTSTMFEHKKNLCPKTVSSEPRSKKHTSNRSQVSDISKPILSVLAAHVVQPDQTKSF